MSELTDRRNAFRTAIAGFIGAKLKKTPKDKDGNYAAATDTECAKWLMNAVSNIGRARVATHPIRIIHSSIKGARSIYVEPAELTAHNDIGTHSLVHGFTADFAISNSPQVPACQLLLQCIVDGRPLISWLRESNVDLTAAFHNDAERAKAIADTLAESLQPEHTSISSELAKQVYWLAGEEPQDDTQYHLLQPMFSSSLDHVLYGLVDHAKDAYFQARGTQKSKPTYADHATYPLVVQRKIGGANPQNVSPLNSVRHGKNYLLASLPPPAWRPRQETSLLKLNSVFDETRGAFLWFGNLRDLVSSLATLLTNKKLLDGEIRAQRKPIEKKIGGKLAEFGTAVRGRYKADWTRDEACHLPLCERLWLNPDRVELPDRDDPEHAEWADDDRTFRETYERGYWADEVATCFSLWLNGQLRKRSSALVTLGESEMRHFARQAILDVAWPIPRQRRATGGMT